MASLLNLQSVCLTMAKGGGIAAAAPPPRGLANLPSVGAIP